MENKHDEQKTKSELIEELELLRQKVAQGSSPDQSMQTADSLFYAEDTLNLLLDATPSGVVVIDAENHVIVEANPAALEMLGASREDVVGRECHNYICPTERGHCPITDLNQTVDRSERVLLNADGGEVPILKTVAPFMLNGRRHLLESFVNLTDHKRVEEALEETVSTLERKVVQSQTAAQVAHDAAVSSDVRDLLERTIRIITDRFGFYDASIFLMDAQQEHVVLRAASSYGGQLALEQGFRLAVGKGIVGLAAASGERCIAPDVNQNPAYVPDPNLPQTLSEAAFPLLVRDQVIGVLDVQSSKQDAFSEDDALTLQTIADQLAVALDKARLAEQAEAQLREMDRLSQDYSATAWSGVTAPGRALGFIYDQVQVSPLQAIPTPALNRALDKGDTVALGGSEESGSALAVPLKVRGQVIGVLGVQERSASRDWSADEIALIEAVSDQVAVALDGARLFAETQKAAQQTRALYETSRALSSSLEEEALMRAILEAMDRTLGCEYALISTVDESSRTIGTRHGIWRGEFDLIPEWARSLRVSLDDPSIVADVHRTGRMEIVEEWDQRFDRQIWDEYEQERLFRVFLPIKVRARVLGVVEVAYDKVAKGRPTQDEIQMSAAFVDQAAAALENVRLFEQAQHRAERERQIYEITTRLRRTPDISTILQTAVDELGKTLQTDRALVRLLVTADEEQTDTELSTEDEQWEGRGSTVL